jgi:hypothetical protein
MDEPFPSVDAPQPMKDLYGFEISHNVVAQAVRLQCDGAALRAERCALDAFCRVHSLLSHGCDRHAPAVHAFDHHTIPS